MKASDEELQAINEELRSASKELETGREELQIDRRGAEHGDAELKLKVEELEPLEQRPAEPHGLDEHHDRLSRSPALHTALHAAYHHSLLQHHLSNLDPLSNLTTTIPYTNIPTIRST